MNGDDTISRQTKCDYFCPKQNGHGSMIVFSRRGRPGSELSILLEGRRLKPLIRKPIISAGLEDNDGE